MFIAYLWLFFQGGLITETSRELFMASEPEAASVWCKKLFRDDIPEILFGTQFIVVDCGGTGLIFYRNPV